MSDMDRRQFVRIGDVTLATALAGCNSPSGGDDTAGGEFGQVVVSNAAVEYDAGADEWTVVDDAFDCEGALYLANQEVWYLANQEVWVSRWGEAFFQGRGVPGRSDEPQ